MVEYLKTKKGYFYKLKKNGEKKRISQEEYNKKKNKTRKNKTRKNKKMIGGASLNMLELMMGRADDLQTDTEREQIEQIEQIEQSDIMYKDDLVCILKPDVKKGIIIWTRFTQPEGMGSLCELGLKTGKKLKEEGVNFGRTKIHPYIFFRAPYYSRDIDYASVETEIISSYGEGQIGTKSRAFIRVDPDKTFVFSSEIRDVVKHPKWNGIEENIINNSKKTLSDYLKIIKENMEITKNVKDNYQIWYNLFSSRAVLFPNRVSDEEEEDGEDKYEKEEDHYPGPFDDRPIEENSEIRVSIPHLTPDYFVLCTPNNYKVKK